jgi:hypothetical protein
VSLLNPDHDAGPDQNTRPPPLFFSAGTPEWEVEDIVCRRVGHSIRYEVKSTGYPVSDMTTPVLLTTDFSLPFTVFTYASGRTIGAALCQHHITNTWLTCPTLLLQLNNDILLTEASVIASKSQKFIYFVAVGHFRIALTLLDSIVTPLEVIKCPRKFILGEAKSDHHQKLSFSQRFQHQTQTFFVFGSVRAEHQQIVQVN